MNYSRLALAAVATWIASIAVGYLVNAVLLADLYAAHAAVFRAPADMRLPAGFVASLVGFFAFAYAYAKGYEGGKGMHEGMRFGVLVALMIIGFGLAWEYAMFPVSGNLFVAWVIDAIVEFSIYGMIVGALYRPVQAVRRAAV